MISITSVKTQCNKLLNDLCKMQYSEELLRLKSNAILLLNERM